MSSQRPIDITGDKRLAAKVWDFLHSAFGMVFLVSIVSASFAFAFSQYTAYRKHRETVHYLKWGIYNEGVDFESEIEQAFNRYAYEAAYDEDLHRLSTRLGDYQGSTLEWMTDELEALGDSEEREQAKGVREGARRVWEKIAAKFGDGDWWANLDWDSKRELDQEIKPIIDDTMIMPFNSVLP